MRLKQATRAMRAEVYALVLAMKHPDTPWYAKALAACVIAYALSPIDLIPDPVPVLGYLDDIIIVPLGVLAVRKLVPAGVLAECRKQAAAGVTISSGWKWTGMIIIGALWLVCIVVAWTVVYRWWAGR
jgi:uncharacterized membrane protein YkvA (DUF1232 family)